MFALLDETIALEASDIFLVQIAIIIRIMRSFALKIFSVVVLLSTILIMPGQSAADESAPPLVTTSTGKRTALTGTGKQINTYIANKIAKAGKGDTVRLSFFIIEHTYKTAYFYDALVEALDNGARVEIITEKANRLAVSKSAERVRNQTEFLYGDGSGPRGLANEGGNLSIYECYYGCNSPDGYASLTFNHNKISLLDINGNKEIIVTSANLRHAGEDEWQAGIAIDGNHYKEQWRWWSRTLNEDKCYASIPKLAKRYPSICRKVGDGGYEALDEGWVTSYTPGPTPKYRAANDWLSDMRYSKGCHLQVATGLWSNTITGRNFLDHMAGLATNGCKVEFIHGHGANAKAIRDHVDDRFDVYYDSDSHGKMILWDEGLGKEKYSWVGSMNISTRAMNNHDESMIRVKGKTEYKAYSRFFEHVTSDVKWSNVR